MDENQKDMLLTMLAQAVQCTEALSDHWPRQKELLALLTPARADMVNSFYENGYFVAQGMTWDAYVEDVKREFNMDLESDLVDFYLVGEREAIRNLIRASGAPIDLTDAAFEFVDAFEG